MITEACAIGKDKLRPLVYINALLSDWKSNGIFTKDKIPQTPKMSNSKPYASQKTEHFASERTYTKEELNALIDSIDDIKF